MRISIMAGSSSRPDTLKQTGSGANLDNPLADGAGHTFLKVISWRSKKRQIRDCQEFVCGAIVTPMEGAYGNQERHPGRFAGGA